MAHAPGTTPDPAPGAQPELLGVAEVPGSARDLSGLTESLSDGTPHNRLGGMGSAIDYTGSADRYLMAADRGPADGATAFHCRFHTVAIRIDPGAPRARRITVELLATTMLTSADGRPFVGLAAAVRPSHPEASPRLDPEGIRVLPSGNILISDEYGPSIEEFNPGGRHVRRIAPPAKFLTEHASPKEDRELPPRSSSGRYPNHGFEGLALLPGGGAVAVVTQGPLLQDKAGRRAKHAGRNLRIAIIPLGQGRAREYVYTMESPHFGVNEILAIDDHRMLVLERDGKGGAKARYRRVNLADLSEASDVSGVDRLPEDALPPGMIPAAKSPFLDLLDLSFGLAGPSMPEKIEGLCFGPILPDGRRALIVSSDNDFKKKEPTRVWVFAIASKAL